MRTYDEEMAIAKSEFGRYSDPNAREEMYLDRIVTLTRNYHRLDIGMLIMVLVLGLFSIITLKIGYDLGFMAGTVNSMELIALKAPSALPVFF